MEKDWLIYKACGFSLLKPLQYTCALKVSRGLSILGKAIRGTPRESSDLGLEGVPCVPLKLWTTHIPCRIRGKKIGVRLQSSVPDHPWLWQGLSPQYHHHGDIFLWVSGWVGTRGKSWGICWAHFKYWWRISLFTSHRQSFHPIKPVSSAVKWE